MERKRKKDNGGFYIAICCCAVVIAIVGYINRSPVNDEVQEEEIVQKSEVVEVPSTTQKPIKAENLPAQNVEKEEKAQIAKKEVNAVSKPVQVEEKIQFNPPVSGKVIEEFSGDDLVYNEALKDWRAHSGVDFEAKIDEQVVCSAKGVVEDVFDSSLGHCVVVDHGNGYKTMYANLNEDTKVKAGDELLEGDVIGTVGNTALGDSTEKPHLHFELIKQNKNVNPVDYLE